MAGRRSEGAGGGGTVGTGEFRYRVVPGWGRLKAGVCPAACSRAAPRTAAAMSM